jgi:hypothetical protein
MPAWCRNQACDRNTFPSNINRDDECDELLATLSNDQGMIAPLAD